MKRVWAQLLAAVSAAGALVLALGGFAGNWDLVGAVALAGCAVCAVLLAVF